jgi:gluconokinase
MTPAVVLIMGVSASGKTTLGRALAERFACRFVDADDLHPPANREKMARGEPLDDHDRRPWLDAIRSEIDAALQWSGEGVELVITCSALRRRYRERLRRTTEPILLVYLQADRETLRQRLEARVDHFFPLSLLDSQLQTLEPPEEGEAAVTLDAAASITELVEAVVREAERRFAFRSTGGKKAPHDNAGLGEA